MPNRNQCQELVFLCILLSFTPYEPKGQKTYHRTCALSEDSDQPAHLRSLIRIVTGHIFGQLRMQQFFMRTTKTDKTAQMHRLIRVFVKAHISKGTFSYVAAHILT